MVDIAAVSPGIAFDAVFAFLRAVLFLPARVLGYRERGSA
jgi:hypothetical protein